MRRATFDLIGLGLVPSVSTVRNLKGRGRALLIVGVPEYLTSRFPCLKRYEHNLTFPAKSLHREAITSNSRSPGEASLETSNFVYIVLGSERYYVFV